MMNLLQIDKKENVLNKSVIHVYDLAQVVERPLRFEYRPRNT